MTSHRLDFAKTRSRSGLRSREYRCPPEHSQSGAADGTDLHYDHDCDMTTPSNRQPERVVPVGEFETNCLRLMDEVQETGTVIVVTKHRRPVVRVSPFREEPPRLVGSCKGQLRIIADIDNEPAILAEDWDMLAHPRT